MGIPSFFSYIIKNHQEIIKNMQKSNFIFNNFYLDSNSIIYDCLRNLDYTEAKSTGFEKELIKNVCLKIDEYIKIIKPTGRIFIAFDGVAPVAKLEQQRTRRYKSSFERKMLELLDDKKNIGWDKTAITPGTDFMLKLDKYIKKYYKGAEKKLGVKQIIISTSLEVGEGEHKIFKFIRETPHMKERTLIYGLDADLIMLGLNHLPIAENIYLFRETPEFIKSINSNFIPNENYILDLPELAKTIIARMNNFKPVNKKQQTNRLYDYIFLCFFLGNDFMPHFPSVNIRTNGIEILLNAYGETIGDTNQNLTDGKNIYWRNVHKFVNFLANDEHENLKQEYKIRNRWEKRVLKKNTLKEKLSKLQSIPIKERDIEKYINPFKQYWQKRYYEKLFDTDINNNYKKRICINYLEGLEWVMKYYTNDCVDWRWYYRYHYPPLLKDLLIYIPHFETVMIEDNDNKPVSAYVQLSYVLPKESLYLLPYKLYMRLQKERSQFYKSNCLFVWSFCKYFWESHVKMPHIDLDNLEKFVETNIKKNQ